MEYYLYLLLVPITCTYYLYLLLVPITCTYYLYLLLVPILHLTKFWAMARRKIGHIRILESFIYQNHLLCHAPTT